MPKCLCAYQRKKWRISLLFEPRDVWVGVYWNIDCTHGHIYVNLLPLLPIHLCWVRGRDPWFDDGGE